MRTLVQNYFLLVVVAVALLLGFLIRLTPAITGNYHFSFDQGLDILMVKQLVENHDINLVSRYSGLQGVLMGPLWTWLLTIPYFFSGGNPTSFLIFLSIVSCISSLAVFVITTKIFGRLTGFLIFLYTLFAPSFIEASKVALSPHLITPLFFFYIFSLYQVLSAKKKYYWLIVAVLLGIFFQLEIAFAIFALPAALVIFFIDIKKQFHNFLIILLSVVIFLASFIPQLVFDLKHNFLISGGLLSFLSGKNQSLYQSSLPLWERFISRVGSFWEDLNTMALLPAAPKLSLLIIFLALLGWLIIFKHRRNFLKEITWLKVLVITLICFYGGFVIYKGPIWGWYRSGLPIVFQIIVTLGLTGYRHFGRMGKIFLVPLVVLFALYINIPGLIGNLTTSRHDSVTNLTSQKEIINLLTSDAGLDKYDYYAYTPPVYDYIWQYQFGWQPKNIGRNTPENLRVNIPLLGIGEQSTFKKSPGALYYYLVIEPNDERPWDPSEWRKKQARGGTLIWEKQLSSGITLAKYRYN